MNEATYFTTPLFDGANGGVERIQVPVSHLKQPAVPAAAASLPPPSPTAPSSITVCTLCRASGQCFQRPVEESWFCARCSAIHRVFNVEFDAASGCDVLSERCCFLCSVNTNSHKNYVLHCASRSHKRRLQRDELSTHCAMDVSNLVASNLRTVITSVLRTFDDRFRRHVSKEQVALLPELKLYDHWEATENQWPLATYSSALPIHSPSRYTIVDVGPQMSLADFNTMLHQLRTERVLGFDTETAPSAFFPHVARVVPQGPHLLQIASRSHVWLISTITKSDMKAIERAKAAEDGCKSLPSEKLDPAKQTALTSDELQLALQSALELPAVSLPHLEKHRRFHVRVLSDVHGGRGRALSNDTVKHRLPQFLVDLLHRNDVALVGFGLSGDTAQLYKLLKQRTAALCSGRSPSPHVPSAPSLESWHPPFIDLAEMFVTDLTSSRDRMDKQQAATVVPSMHMEVVGTVQAGARIFRAHFHKPKSSAVGNWAVPSKMLGHKLRMYACRDAVFPLFAVDKLLELRASVASQSKAPPVTAGDTWSLF